MLFVILNNVVIGVIVVFVITGLFQQGLMDFVSGSIEKIGQVGQKNSIKVRGILGRKKNRRGGPLKESLRRAKKRAGFSKIQVGPAPALLNNSFTNNKFRILELMGLKYSKEIIEKKQVRQFILSILTPFEIEINKWGQDDLEELADALYTLTINFWGVYCSLKEKNRGT